MKALQINCVYPVGSTGRIAESIDNYLWEQKKQSVICYGRGSRVEKANVHKVSSELEAKVHSALCYMSGMRFAYSPIATTCLINRIRKEKPDVVHLHCLNGNFVNVYRLLTYLKKQNIRTVLTLHAEIMHTAGCEFAYDCEKWQVQCKDCLRIRGKLTHFFRDDAQVSFLRMQKAFQGFQNLTIVGVSDWITERAKKSGVFRDCDAAFCTVKNGVKTEVFRPEAELADQLRKKHGLTDEKIVLHVTPDFRLELKGGRFVLEMARRKPEWKFVIVGYYAVEEELPDNVITVAHTDSQRELAGYYSMADVTLLTSKRETFSMVCAESLCCGTPVVGFCAGAPETITMSEYSEFVPFGDTDLLCSALENMLQNEISVDTEITRKHYDRDTMSQAYANLYEQGDQQ